MAKSVEVGAPDDFHVHLRDGAILSTVVSYTASQFHRALVMPNLVPPIRTVSEAASYRARILAALPHGSTFQPLMSLYLTDNTTVDEIKQASESSFVIACKLYPAGATTNSSSGVSNIDNIRPVLRAMQDLDLVLCLHGEVTKSTIDMFDREKTFINDILPALLSDYPRLRIVLEHATTAAAVEAVEAAAAAGSFLAATLTPHHLVHSRNALFQGARLHPDMFCLPILKREDDREALLRGISGPYSHRFFAGTDSAPHTRDSKLCEDGCAGIFNAPVALQCYAAAFEEADALSKLRAFLSENGAKFYGLQPNKMPSTFVSRIPFKVVSEIAVPDGRKIRPLAAGETLEWKCNPAGAQEDREPVE